MCKEVLRSMMHALAVVCDPAVAGKGRGVAVDRRLISRDLEACLVGLFPLRQHQQHLTTRPSVLLSV